MIHMMSYQFTDFSVVSDYLYLLDSKTLEYTWVGYYEQSQGAGPQFGHSDKSLIAVV